jgi:S1-C subfamily serine protease
MQLNPQEIIVPIFAIGTKGEVVQFLGTGSFVGDPPLLITADHVIRDWQGSFGISILPKLHNIYVAKIVARDPSHDLSLLEVSDFKPAGVLDLAPKLAHLNQLLCTFEYGTTRTQGNQIHISPATRIGNITRTLNLISQYQGAGDEILELSFSALKGASGAPVVSNDDKFQLQGIIIANVSYHLLPAQISSVLDEDNQILEETQFMLPQALAVNVKHVQAFLNTVQP